MRGLKKIKKSIFGYDIFISYSRLDSLQYAYSIAKLLINDKYECYIDQLVSRAPGKDITPAIKKAIRKSTAFILIGSAGAQNSKSVHQEVTLFLSTKKNNPVIPISINNSICEKAIWYENIAGIQPKTDSIQNLKDGKPDETVIQQIRDALTFTKKSIRLRKIAFAILAAVTVVTIVAFFITILQVNIAQEANRNEQRANVLADSATKQANSAQERQRTAEILATKAIYEKKLAVSETGKAIQNQQFAEYKASVAYDKERKSNLVANSNYLITRSNLLENKFFAVDTALLAYDIHPSDLADSNVSTLFLKYPFIYTSNLDEGEKLEKEFTDPRIYVEAVQKDSLPGLEIHFVKKIDNVRIRTLKYNLHNAEIYKDAEVFQQESTYLILLKTFIIVRNLEQNYILSYDSNFNLLKSNKVEFTHTQVDFNSIKGLFMYKINNVTNYIVVLDNLIGEGFALDNIIRFEFDKSDIKIENVIFNEKSTFLVTKILTGLFIQKIKPDRSDDPFLGTSLYLPGIFPDRFFFIGNRFLGLLMSDEFYVLDLDLNPNVANGHLSVSEIANNRKSRKEDFNRYLKTKNAVQ